MKELYSTLARYNRWANDRLYDACAQLSPDAYYQDRQAFFSSIHGTLNHMLLADRIWMGRLVGPPYAFITLRDEVYPHFESLRHARQLEDEHMMAYVDELPEGAIAQEFAYQNTSGAAFVQPLWQILTHVFNHQTHHRGQVHQMLGEAGVSAPALDFAFMTRDSV